MTCVFSASDVTCVMPTAEGAERVIFAGIDLELAAGQIIDLVGPSGAGKSSLLTAFARLNPHANGTFRLQGRDASEFSPQQWRREVAYLPQQSILPGASVAEALRLPFTLAVRRGDKAPDEAELRAMLDALGCGDIELSRPPHDLSGGQAARVSLARVLTTHPKILLADEVDAGLDEENADVVAEVMARMAAKTGMAVIRIRHRPPDGRASRVMRLEHGELTEVTR